MLAEPPKDALSQEFSYDDGSALCGGSGIKELTSGLGAHSVIEAAGTQESIMQAIRSTRPGGPVGYVGVAHDVQLPGEELFFPHVPCTAAPPRSAGSCPN